MSHAVCWIPARGDLYLVFFGLTCILLFIKWAKENKPYILFISAFFFFMSLISKESAITILPLLAMIYYFNFEQKISLKKLWWTIPYLMVAGIYFMLRKPAVIKTPFLGIDAFIYNLPTLPEEIFKFFIPLDYSVMPGFNHAITIAGLVLIFVLSGIIYWQRKNIDLKIILTGVCFFIFPLLPSLFYKPVFVGSSYDYLDHRMFFCGIGLLIITGILLKKYIESDSKIFKATGYAVVVISAVISFAYSETYKNYNNFYRNAISKNEKSGLALTNYSNLLFNKEGKYEEAMQLIEKAIALNPDSMYYTFKKCGYAYMQKDIPVTKNCSEKLITKWPNKYDSNFIRSGYFLLTKDYEESIRYSTKTIEINPNKADGYFNRGLAYKETGNFDAAINDFTTCTRLSPQFANAYFHRGNIYGNTGNFSAALIDFDKYVKLSPDEAMGYFYRGQAYCFSGNAADGCRDLKKAQKMGLPDNIDNLLQKFCQ
jgi:tetratricopeptide (TPR) repeat protein